MNHGRQGPSFRRVGAVTVILAVGLWARCSWCAMGLLHEVLGTHGRGSMPRLPTKEQRAKLRRCSPLGMLNQQQPIPFSFWPVGRTTRRYGLQSRVFTSDPWGVISERIEEQCPKNSREAARSFLAQGEDFYDASQASKVPFAKPTLLYYSFMNLVKAFILTAGRASGNYRPQHGMSERANLRQIEGAIVTVDRPQAEIASFLTISTTSCADSDFEEKKGCALVTSCHKYSSAIGSGAPPRNRKRDSFRSKTSNSSLIQTFTGYGFAWSWGGSVSKDGTKPT